MNRKGIFFDLYGTLFIFGDMNAAWRDWSEAYFALSQEYGCFISEKEFKNGLNGFFSKPKPVIIDSELSLYQHRIKDHAESINFVFSADQLHCIASATINAWQNHIRLDNETIPLLKKLKPYYTLALVSNFDHPNHVYSLLADLELAPLFDEIIISGEVGADKPDPKIFRVALQRTNLEPKEVFFVGDSVEDMEGAKAVGLNPVYIKREREKDDHVVVDFHNDPFNQDRIQKQPEKIGIIEISKLSELLELTGKDKNKT